MTSAAAKGQLQVLRVGVVQEGRVVQERLIPAGSPVTIGESARCTFVLPRTSLPRKGFTLFAPKGKGYVLQVTRDMRGALSLPGRGIVKLEDLRSRPGAAHRGDTWQIPLDPSSRGKVVVGPVTILFQFVPAPPEPLRPTVRQDFRPRLIDMDDPVFLGFLAVFTALAAVLLVYVANTEVPETTGLEDIPDRFVEIILPPKKEKPPEPELPTDEGAEGESIQKKREAPKKAAEQAEKEAAEQAEVAEKAPEAPKSEAEQAREELQRQQALEQEVMKKAALLQMIATTGENNSGERVSSVFGEDDTVAEDLDKALQGVTGVEVAQAGAPGVREGTGVSREGSDIETSVASAAGAAIASGPAVKVEGKVATERGDTAGLVEGDPEQIQRVVAKFKGQIKYCYDKRLKENPNLAGRVEVSWVIARGRVTTVSVIANSTGDDELAQCIVRKIKRWKFGEGAEGEVMYPFVLTQ